MPQTRYGGRLKKGSQIISDNVAVDVFEPSDVAHALKWSGLLYFSDLPSLDAGDNCMLDLGKICLDIKINSERGPSCVGFDAAAQASPPVPSA